MKNIRVFYRHFQKFFILISDLFYYKFCPERFSIIKSRYGSRYESWKKMILFILLIEQSNVKKMSYKSVTFSNLNFHLIWWQTFSRLYYVSIDNITKHTLAPNNLNCELFLREKRFSGVPKILFNTNNFVISIRALLPAQHTILWAPRWYRYYIYTSM